MAGFDTGPGNAALTENDQTYSLLDAQENPVSGPSISRCREEDNLDMSLAFGLPRARLTFADPLLSWMSEHMTRRGSSSQLYMPVSSSYYRLNDVAVCKRPRHPQRPERPRANERESKPGAGACLLLSQLIVESEAIVGACDCRQALTFLLLNTTLLLLPSQLRQPQLDTPLQLRSFFFLSSRHLRRLFDSDPFRHFAPPANPPAKWLSSTPSRIKH